MPICGAVEIGAALGRVGLVGEAQHRGRMRVVDEFVRQEGVQQRLDRRVRRAGSSRLARWMLTMSSSDSASRARSLRSGARRTAGRPAGSISADVPAAALDAQHLGRVADEVGQHGLDRGVAAAMQHEARIAAEQARGMRRAARDQAPMPRRAVTLDDRLRVGRSTTGSSWLSPSRTALASSPTQYRVGWVERSETHPSGQER